ncbi:MAG: HIT family protein [Dehalogenimonas sp.]
MEQLWAPWRAQLFENYKGDGCIFCDLPAMDDDAKTLILYRGEKSFVIMNAYPYAAGHLMVVPFRHVARLSALTAEERQEIMDLTARCESAITAAMNPEGFNVGFNLGRAGGAGVDAHLHCHIVPRWVGDTNFMPVIGGTRVINESLEDTYNKIKECFS